MYTSVFRFVLRPSKEKEATDGGDDIRKLTTEAERNAYFLQLREKGEGGREGFGTPNAGAAAIH